MESHIEVILPYVESIRDRVILTCLSKKTHALQQTEQFWATLFHNFWPNMPVRIFWSKDNTMLAKAFLESMNKNIGWKETFLMWWTTPITPCREPQCAFFGTVKTNSLCSNHYFDFPPIEHFIAPHLVLGGQKVQSIEKLIKCLCEGKQTPGQAMSTLKVLWADQEQTPFTPTERWLSHDDGLRLIGLLFRYITEPKDALMIITDMCEFMVPAWFSKEQLEVAMRLDSSGGCVFARVMYPRELKFKEMRYAAIRALRDDKK